MFKKFMALPSAARCVVGALLSVVAGVGGGAGGAWAQGPDFAWRPGFHVAGAGACGGSCITGVRTMVTFDDGAGPAFYVGGGFSVMGLAQARNVARYDPVNQWASLGDGLPDMVTKLVVLPGSGGAGDRLFAASGPNGSGFHIHSWDGMAWTDQRAGLPAGVPVNDMVVYAVGKGAPALYAALGDAFELRDRPGRIFRFDGSHWTEMSNGGFLYPAASRLHVMHHADGTSELICGTGWISNHAPSYGRVFRITDPAPGNSWAPIGARFGFGIQVVQTYRGVAEEPELYVGGAAGFFGPPTGLHVFRGGEWERVGTEEEMSASFIGDLVVMEVEGRQKLVAAGKMMIGGETPGVGLGAWDGEEWKSLVSSVSYAFFTYDPVVWAAGYLVSGEMVIGGDFTGIDGVPASGLAVRRDGSWTEAAARGNGFIGWAGTALHVAPNLDNGQGPPRLLGAGLRMVAGSGVAPGIYSLEGEAWARAGKRDDVEWVRAFATLETASGPEVYAVGNLDYDISDGVLDVIVRWDGTDWRPHMTTSCNPSPCTEVNTIVAFENTLFAGGDIMFDGVVRGVMRLVDGEWQVTPNAPRNVKAMEVVDFGSGPELYCAGSGRLARWTGKTWVDVAGVTGEIRAMRAWKEGGQTRLYVAGSFTQVGPASVLNIARFDGDEWAGVGGGIVGSVNALEVFDDGEGAALFAAGNFATAGAASARSIAKWDGVAWSGVDGGIQGRVYDLQAFADERGPALYAVGAFGVAGDVVSVNVAKYGRSGPACAADWNGDGNLGSQDFFDFLGDFFAGAADYNGDALTNSADFFDFVLAFLAGCGE